MANQNQREENLETKESVISRVGGYLHKIIPVVDKSGQIISYALKPLMVEFKPRDTIQVMVGSALLAIPLSMTEEAWNLGEKLPTLNIAAIGLLSMVLVAAFVYYNFYRNNFKGQEFNYLKRVIGTYSISFLVVTLILTLLQKCPWGIDNQLAVNRIIIVTFPAVLSGTLSDMIK